MQKEQFMELTGISCRQLYYWQPVMDICHPGPRGKGYRRNYKREAVHKIRTIVNITQTLGAYLPVDLLAQIFDNYEWGKLEFEDFALSWTVDNEIDAPSAGGGGQSQ